VTTAKQEVKAFVAPLLSSHPNMVLIGRAIVLKPVHHLLRTIYIDRTSSAHVCQPNWGVSGLWSKNDSWSLGHGDRLHRLWNMTQPDLPRLLVEDVEGIALPKLEAVKTIRDYIALSMPSEEYRIQYVAAYVRHLLVLGEFDEARMILKKDERTRWWLGQLDELGIKDRLMDLGNDLGRNDRLALAGLFHEWEAYSVEKLKIGHLWERTPFPLEEGVVA
jgi:hypothetical protein